MLLSSFFKNAPDIEIRQLSCDSRMPMEDCIFFCAKGIKDDGHNFVKEAIFNGAKVVVYENDIDTSLPCIYIKVNDVLDVLNVIASKFYGHPGKAMENFVVAGSSNRNSVSFIINQIVSNYRSCGYIGSLGINFANTKLMSSEPTLTILDNQRYLLKMKESGVEACVFEADYLGLDLKKIDAIYPKSITYTNTISSDSDYKKMYYDYAESIVRYIKNFDTPLDIIFNSDDETYERIKKILDNRIVTYSIRDEGADYYATNITIGSKETSFTLRCFQNTYQVTTNLIGMQSVYSLLAAIATLSTRGYPISEIVAYCRNLLPPDGIMQRIDCGQKYEVVVDSANTYNDLTNVLKFARSVVDAKHRIVVMVGLSAYSSEEKRQKYGTLLDKYADLIILTEDDAHEESVFQISNDIIESIKNKETIVIENRELAIYSAIELLNERDMFLCLGKGNEKIIYRSLGKEAYDGDVEIVKKYIKKRLEEENGIIEVY